MVHTSSLLFWIPIFIFVTIEHSKSNFYTLTRIIPLLLLIYLITFFVKHIFKSTIFKLSIHFIFYIFLYFFGSEIQTVSLAFGVIFLASILIISFGLPAKMAIFLIIPILIIEFLIVDQIGNKLILSGAGYNIYFFILYHAIIGTVAIALTYTLDRELRYIDSETAKFAADNKSAYEITLQRQLIRNLRSKIHGTLLNNLSLIGQKRYSPTNPDFISDLKGNLNESDLLENTLGDITLEEVISQVSNIQSNTAPKLAIAPIPLVTLSKKLSSDLTEVLKEVLRNIDRHADAKNISLKFFLKNYTLKVQITDDGKGPELIQYTRLGTKSTILETLEAVGGSISHQAMNPSGTVTEIRFPTVESSTLDNLSEKFLIRRLFPNYLKLIFLFPYLALGVILFFDPAVTINSITTPLYLLVLLFLVLSLFPDIANIKQAYPTLSLLFTLLFSWNMTSVFNSCATAGGWNWIVTTFSISMTFYLVFQQNKILRWVGLPIFVIAHFIFSLFIPSACRSVVLLPLLNGLIAGIALAIAFVVFYKKTSEKIKLYENVYKSDNLIQANSKFLQMANSYWKVDPKPGLEIVSEANKNLELLQQPHFLRKAMLEQARLRSLLVIDPLISSELNKQILDIIAVADESHNIFELEFHGNQSLNPKVPEIYFEWVEHLVKITQESAVVSKVFSSSEDLQISLLTEYSAFEAVANRMGYTNPEYSNWVLETEKINDEGVEKIWFLLTYTRTNDESARYARTSSTQIASR
jgi:signal transduction histidine kinase